MSKQVGFSLVGDVLEALFPRFCVKCGVEGALLCDLCFFDWRPKVPLETCCFCRKPSAFGAVCVKCKASARPDAVLAEGYYADPIARSLLHHWKYYFDLSASEIIERCIKRQEERVLQFMSEWQVESIVPVPLHYKRYCERGFDQSFDMAGMLSRSSGLPVWNVLRRMKSTGTQVGRAPDERTAAMQGKVFQLIGAPPASVLLVDDVWTTGATLLSATAALKEAGVDRVVAWTWLKG